MRGDPEILSISAQFREALTLLAVLALSFPLFFTAADWLRG